MSPFQSYTAAHVLPVPLPLPRRLVARRLAAQCRGLRRPGGRHRGRVAGRRRHHCAADQRRRDSGHAECTQSRVPALDGRAGGAARLACRQLLDLARDHVRARQPHDAGGPQRRRGAMLCGHAQGRLYGRVRVSLPAQPAGRQPLCGPGRDVPGADRCGGHGWNRAHFAADAVPDCRFRRRPADAAPAAVRARDGSVSRSHRRAVARPRAIAAGRDRHRLA